MSSAKTLTYADGTVREILNSAKVIAMVGASENPVRPSYIAFKYLQARGFKLIGINPASAGKTILGAPVYARLADVPEPIDIVDIFRNSDAAGAIVDEALALTPLPKVIWMQLTVRNDDAAARAEAAGLQVIMDRCPKIEYGRLTGEIGWTGVNSRRLSSRRATLMDGFQKRRLT